MPARNHRLSPTGPAFAATTRPALLLILALALAWFVGAPPPAQAHAILVESFPAAGASVNGPVVKFKLRFNSRIDTARCHLTLVRPGHKEEPLTLEKQDNPAVLATGPVSGLTPGAYRVRWQVLAADGHITTGLLPFTVQ